MTIAEAGTDDMKSFSYAGAGVVLLSAAWACRSTDPSQPVTDGQGPLGANTQPPGQTSSVVSAARNAAPRDADDGGAALRPYCPVAAAADAGSADGGAGDSTWLATATMQSRVEALDRELQPHEADLIGIHFDDARRTAVVVFHSDVPGLEELEAGIRERVAPLRVELRHGCHSRERIQAALAVLEARAWHPKAKTTPIGWHLDASFSGYAVVVDEDAPEVAEALRAQLEPVVRVTLGKPRRYGNP